MVKRGKHLTTAATLEASYKRALYGAPTEKIDVNRFVDQSLYTLLGRKYRLAPTGSEAANSTSASAGGSSAYTSAQASPGSGAADGGFSFAGSGGAGALGLVGSLANIVYAEYARRQQNKFNHDEAIAAWERNEESYSRHFSMDAKVQEYEEAGLNPYGLAGSGVGATSLPSNPAASAGNAMPSGLTEVLGTLLNYKLGHERNMIQARGIDAQIEERYASAELKRTINAWYGRQATANISKIEADTSLALARIDTEAVQQALGAQKISTEYAKAALLFQQAIGEQIKNRYADAFEQNTLRLQAAEIAYKNSATAENYAQVQTLAQQRQLMVLDCAKIVAQTGKIEAETKVLGIRADMLEFDKAHQKGNLIWQRVGQACDALESVTGSASNLFSCFSPVPTPHVSKVTTRRQGKNGYYEEKYYDYELPE